MRCLLTCFTVVVAILLVGCARPPQPTIVYKPINLGKRRIQLTRRYRCQQYQLCDRDVMITPQIIMLQWTGTATWQAAYNQFRSPEVDGHLNASVQFLVARSGTIYQLMPSSWMARHTYGLDDKAIAIANVGGENDQANLTPAQIYSDAFVIRMLKRQYPTIQYLIGHYESACFRYTALWGVEDDDGNVVSKKGPGPKFMQAVRQQVADLNLLNCRN